MRQRSFFLIALLAIMALALPFGGATYAQETTNGLEPFKRQRPQLDPDIVLTPDGERLSQRSGSTKVVIELLDAPAAQVYGSSTQAGETGAQATANAQQQLAQIEQTQQSVVRTLRSGAIGATVLYRTQRVYNGIAVKVDANKLEQIRQLPNVKAIHPLTTKYLDNASSVPLIGAPQLWDDTVGSAKNTGQGLKIGIIDTGIDYLHKMFGGPGTGYKPAGDPNYTKLGDGFPSAKVLGGYDFAGDDYDASDPNKDTPAPDPDPMDCNGHGTHVAGTAAGFGVEADGDTYTGPYGPTTNFDALRIGPGVAPQASLYALKVFGCDGSTDVTDLAIEWAVDPNGDGDFSDRLDVINMSLGAPYGGAYDTSAIASDNAVLAGVIVVTSAGNEGDTFYVSGAPGTAARAIATASSVDSTSVFDGFQVVSTNPDTPAIEKVHPADFSQNYDWENAAPVTGELVYPPSQRTGCQAFTDANKSLIAGKIVLLDWTDNQCGSVTRGANARAAGAIGFILVDNSEVFDLSIFGDAVIPGVSTPKEVGDALKAALAAGTQITVKFSNEFANAVKVVNNNIVDTLSDFSSRGPRRDGSFLKPDIAAPGQSITSAQTGSGDESLTISGTSMAAPHVAGTMALLKQLHPTWTVEELKALVMNTATSNVRSAPASDSPLYGPGRVGAGRVTVPNAAQSQSIAYNANDAGVVSVSFGAPEVVDTAGTTTDFSATKTIRVVNKSSGTITYNVSYTPSTDIPGVTYTLSRTSLTLPAGGFGSIRVTMTADATAMRHIRDVTISPTQVLSRHWMSEESGYVFLDPSSGPNLRVPVYSAPRRASLMHAKSNSLDFSSTEALSGTIELVGQGINTGTSFPTDTLSIVTAYELQHTSLDNPQRPGTRNADLQYVGVASDYPTVGSMNDATIVFGIATHDEWESPNAVTFWINIDTNRDGTYDYRLYNTNLGSAQGGDATDVFITVLRNLSTNALSLQSFLNGLPASAINTAPFNSRVMALPVSAADLGLNAGSGAFNYQVVSFSRDQDLEDLPETADINESVVDQTPVLSYNPAQPGIDATEGSIAEGLPAFADLNGEEITVKFNATTYNANKSQGVLLLHHHNVPSLQAEVVTIRGRIYNQAYKIYLPLVTNTPPTTHTATLSGANEVPPVTTNATGQVRFNYNATTRVLSYTVTVANINNITAAHIHRGAPGVNGPVAYPIYNGGGTFGPGSPLTGSVTLSESDAALLASGGLYVNVHTTTYPGGEIRGQIVAGS